MNFIKKRSENELKIYIQNLRERIQNKDSTLNSYSQIIALKNSNQMIGQVSAYWVCKETQWLDIGIVIFDENFWGKGIGEKALKLWMTKVFITFPKIIRLGLSTWSGNMSMMTLAEKLGLRLDAVYAKQEL